MPDAPLFTKGAALEEKDMELDELLYLGNVNGVKKRKKILWFICVNILKK